MSQAVKHLEETLARIRAGKANVEILDEVRVESYGTMMPLNQVSAVTTPDARTIAIKPWDKSMMRPIPPLTEERRKELAKQCNKEGETAKVSIRNVRRETIDKLKKSIKDGVSEDNEKDAEQTLQKLHDKFIKQVDELLAIKNKEIMTV